MEFLFTERAHLMYANMYFGMAMIPPASPAIKKTQGVLTVNGQMMICTSLRGTETEQP